MTNEEWYTLGQASLKMGKSRGYLSMIKKNYPEYFEDVELKQLGRNLVISKKDLDEVMKHVKKEGDRLRIALLKTVYKAKKQSFCFYPIIV